MVQTESRVWSDSGAEPAVGDEVYTGQERPIAEYDNWAMWAVTKDIDTLATILDSLEAVESITRMTFDTEANRPAEVDLTLADDEGWIYLELDTGRIYSVKDDGAGNPVWFQLGIGEDDVGSTELATDAVGTTHLQTDAVDADAIAVDAVESSEIQTGAVGTDEISVGAVTSGKIATDAIGSAEISADAVGSSEIDLSISPTWTSNHTFEAPVSVDSISASPDGAQDEVTRFNNIEGSNTFVTIANAGNTGDGTREVLRYDRAGETKWEIGFPAEPGESGDYRLRVANGQVGTSDEIFSIHRDGILELKGSQIDNTRGITVGKSEKNGYVNFYDGSGTSRVEMRYDTGDYFQIYDSFNSEQWMRFNPGGQIDIDGRDLYFSGGLPEIYGHGSITWHGPISEPSAPGNQHATVFIDETDGDLKVKFGNGTVRTLASN